MLVRRRQFDHSPSHGIRSRFPRAKLRQYVQEYQDFVAAAGSQIGELSPLVGEDLSDIRVLLRMAARAMGVTARIWVDDGKVYFYVRR